MLAVPTLILSKAPSDWRTCTDLSQFDWRDIPHLPPFLLAESGKPAEQQTTARLCADNERLYAHFECCDRDIWGSYVDQDQWPRDQKIYNEEVVELFIGVADGNRAISHYFEFEVNPHGVLLDVAIFNPNSEQQKVEVDFSWHCRGIGWSANRQDDEDRWQVTLAIPWRSLTTQSPIPSDWRGNFYRIERPRDGTPPEFSCWSPTMNNPADFHEPACFGKIIRPNF